MQAIFKNHPQEQERISDLADYLEKTGLKLFKEKDIDHQIITQLAKKSLRTIESSLE